MKTIYWVLGGLALATTAGIIIYKNMQGSGKPSLESYDAIKKTAVYKLGGKNFTINLAAGESAQVGDYQIEPIKLEVNVSGKNIGDVIGVLIKKNGQVIEKLTN